MLDCCSLLTMIQEEKKLHDVYYRIRDMIDGEDEVNQKIGPRYEILMGLINYPTETRRDWAIKQLGTLIRFILVPMFTDDVNIIESHTKCQISNIKPKKRGKEFQITLPCESSQLSCGCSVEPYIRLYEDTIRKICRETRSESNPYFSKLNELIELFFEEDKDIAIEECKRLGDVIISLDRPESHTLVTGDDDVRIVCNVLEHECIHIPPV